jgi:predicted metal-dependent peptidase
MPRISSAATPAEQQAAQIKLMQVRERAVSFQPFFAPLLYSFRYVDATGYQGMTTMGVYAADLLCVYSAHFVNKGSQRPDGTWAEVTRNQLALVLLHEAQHVILRHAERWEDFKKVLTREGKYRVNHRLWNLAADCEINSSLLKIPLIPDYRERPGQRTVSIPDWAWFPSSLTPAQRIGLLAEEYYPYTPNAAKDGAPPPPQPPDEQPGTDGGGAPPDEEEVEGQEGEGEGEGQEGQEGEGGGAGGPGEGFKVGDKVKINATGEEGVIIEAGPFDPDDPSAQEVKVEPISTASLDLILSMALAQDLTAADITLSSSSEGEEGGDGGEGDDEGDDEGEGGSGSGEEGEDEDGPEEGEGEDDEWVQEGEGEGSGKGDGEDEGEDGGDARPDYWDGDHGAATEDELEDLIKELQEEGEIGPGANQGEKEKVMKECADAHEAWKGGGGHGRGQGTGPALQRAFDEIRTPPTIKWNHYLRAVLRNALSPRGKTRRSYRKPGRRSYAYKGGKGPVFQGSFGTKADIAVVCDTSGSMSPESLSYIAKELQAAVRNPNLENVWAISVDARAAVPKKLTSKNQIAKALVGGGGTDMSAGIRMAATINPLPKVCLVITDGGTPWPSRAEIPVGMQVVIALVPDYLGTKVDKRMEEATREWAPYATVIAVNMT